IHPGPAFMRGYPRLSALQLFGSYRLDPVNRMARLMRLCALLAICLVLTHSLFAGTVVDFRQAANNDTGYGLQTIHWITSIIQDNNSMYFEGMSVRQRLLVTGLPSTSGNHHSLLFRHQFSKGSAHAYDFLTSYDQARAEDVADFGTAATLNACG